MEPNLEPVHCPPHLQYPGPLASEGVAGVENVPVLGEAGQHVLHTLLHGVHLLTKSISQQSSHFMTIKHIHSKKSLLLIKKLF